MLDGGLLQRRAGRAAAAIQCRSDDLGVTDRSRDVDEAAFAAGEVSPLHAVVDVGGRQLGVVVDLAGDRHVEGAGLARRPAGGGRRDVDRGGAFEVAGGVGARVDGDLDPSFVVTPWSSCVVSTFIST